LLDQFLWQISNNSMVTIQNLLFGDELLLLGMWNWNGGRL